MPTCEAIRIKKKKLCAGDMRQLVRILERSQTVGAFDNAEAIEVFVEIGRRYMAVKTIDMAATVGGTYLINGIQADPGATHVFYCRYSALISALDRTKNVLEHKGQYYRILKANNLNEDNLTMAFQCALRGDATKEASHA